MRKRRESNAKSVREQCENKVNAQAYFNDSACHNRTEASHLLACGDTTKNTDDTRTHTALPSSAEMQCAFPSRPLRAQKRGLYTDLRYPLFTELPAYEDRHNPIPTNRAHGALPCRPQPKQTRKKLWIPYSPKNSAS